MRIFFFKKNTLYLLIFFFIIFFLEVKTVIGQNQFLVNNPIPLLDCGVAGVSGRDRCCNLNQMALPNPPLQILNAVPGVNIGSNVLNQINQIQANLNQLQQSTQAPCMLGEPTDRDYSSPNCYCKLSISPTPLLSLEKLCEKYLKGYDVTLCRNCLLAGGFRSGLGCIPLRVDSLINDYLLTFGIGLAGGFALICIIYGAILIQTSSGSPEKLKKGQELITSCIIGLILILFSVFILRFIGKDILRIPGIS